jgi:type I restriction enzyme S subunit
MIEMKDSGIEWIGTIPKNWNLLRIQYGLYEIKENNTLKKTSQVLSLVKDNGVMLYEEKGNKGNKSKEDISQYKIAYPNTLIVNSMNILIGSVGISKYTGCVSPVYYVFKETEQTDLRYINYIFNTREFQKELRKYANGILEIRLRVSANDIFKRKIPFPNKQTQKLIADFLDQKCSEIDTLTADIQTQIETLKEYKKSVITEAVTKGLDPNVEMKDSGVEWIGKIPKDWGVIPVKFCFSITNGSDPRSDEGDTPVYGSGKGHFKTCKEFKKGPTVLLGRKGTVNIPQWIEGNYWNVDTAFDVHAKGNYLLKLFFYAASCFDYDNYSTQTALPSMTQSNYLNFRIPFMNVEEQRQIVDFLDQKCSEIDLTISEKQQQLETLAEYKKSLIYECVTGKKEVL